MLKKQLTVVLLTLLFATATSEAKDIAGIDMPDYLQTGESQLILNGAGVRTKFFLDLYVGGLYLIKRDNDPQNIINAEEPMAIRLHIVSSMITSEKMEKATREGFEKATDGNTQTISDRIEQFISVFKEKIKENDVFTLIYVPGKGVQVYKNNEFKSLLHGLFFKKALFGIWFCDKPAQKSLKQAMLGK
jgi:hypothetical protein